MTEKSSQVSIVVITFIVNLLITIALIAGFFYDFNSDMIIFYLIFLIIQSPINLLFWLISEIKHAFSPSNAEFMVVARTMGIYGFLMILIGVPACFLSIA